MRSQAWQTLGLDPTKDKTAIRRAYAKALKAIDPETDPPAFIALRQAFEWALAEADWDEEEEEYFDPLDDPVEMEFVRAVPAEPLVRSEPAPPVEVKPTDAGPSGPSVRSEPVPPEPPPAPPSEPSVRSEPVPPEPPPAPPSEPSVRSEPVPPEPPPAPPSEPSVRSEPVPADPPAAEPDEPPRFALPMLDPAPIARLEALLLHGAEPESRYEIADLTHAIITDPATDRIEVAQATENFIAGLIARSMPRSDDMIDVAAAHFGWDRDELSRPPLIAWVLRRREDRAFEADLLANNDRYGKVLEALWRPPPRLGRLTLRRRGVEVEYLLAYLRRAHPTVLNGLDPDTLEFWENHIAAERDRGGIGARLRERMWRRICRSGLWPQPRRVDISLAAMILILPYIFGWLLLRRGYSPTARAVGFTWMVAVIFLILVPDVFDPPRSSSGPPPLMFSEKPDYGKADEDLQPVLSGVSERLTLAQVEPRTRAALEARWREARDSKEPKEAFRDGAWKVIDAAYSGALRGGSYELLKGFWRLRAEKLDWTSRMAPMRCEAVLTGSEDESTISAYHRERTRALIRQALVEGTGRRPPPPRRSGKYSLPHEIIAAAAKRAGLPFEKMRKILTSDPGAGPSAERCRAEAAYILALLDQPEKKARPLLRSMSGGL